MNNQILLSSISIDDFKSFIYEEVKKALSEQDQTSTHDELKDELLDTKEVAKLFNVSAMTVHNWKMDGILPFHRISRRVYFKKDEVLEAMRKIQIKRSERL